MSIGAVLEELRPDFPDDISISKIRFLEAEGLVTPARTASGYRRFTAYDCARLRYILTAQRDQYLPLKVIKAQLDELPDGELPDPSTSYGAPKLVGGEPTPVRVVRLTRDALIEQSGIAHGPAEDLLTALTRAGVITPIFKGAGTVLFDEHAVTILQCAGALADHGVEPRHLRAFRSAADRQSDLIAQIAGPLGRADRAGARDRADDLAREVAALAITLHTSLIKSAVRDLLQR
ncbi:transcriptional regulator FtsR [Mycolicibacterium brumae]|uniref:MerR family transcriptional regulator n=1 Tax=Mycolicibacterium brumae TaxID=85968 RepID=A0A2G5PDS4_9MYCO|nr:MerR family transcriptional regulator [Mycolicibacterium brumae]MCV7192864.1 MerR family transcriptional regulator [Mycolicibacterium brumae]PIB76469.1 MerR family transcriptional regulator [Mycolicibacterium brumae]RWA23453.1 hypothetical protein MBRU_01130 [Mycolicibacterium brumae DSM 44177]UWW08616.1 MerR family transcriptional regulator [Mycolicibacterium brumae]